jgi:hypothetical protein
MRPDRVGAGRYVRVCGLRPAPKAEDQAMSYAPRTRSRQSAPVPLEYWITWPELGLCGMVILIDHARDNGFSPDGSQVV